MPGTWRSVRWWLSIIAILLCNVRSFQGVLCKINSSTTLEKQLKLCFTRKLSILLGTNFSANVIRTEYGLLDFDLQMKGLLDCGNRFFFHLYSHVSQADKWKAERLHWIAGRFAVEYHSMRG